MAAVVAAAAVDCAAAYGGPGVEASVGVGLDVMKLAEPGTEQGVGEELALFERRAGIVPEQTAEERSVPVVAAAVVVADGLVPEATAWTAGVDGSVGTVAGITVLGSWVSQSLALHHPQAVTVEAGRTASPVV